MSTLQVNNLQIQTVNAEIIQANTISTSSDITISGNVVASAFSGNGAALTSITPSDNTISTAKLVDGSVTQAKIDPGVSLGGGLFQGDNGSVGSSPEDIFRINTQTLNANVTIANTHNASATGPVTVANGVILTVQTGGTLRIL